MDWFTSLTPWLVDLALVALPVLGAWVTKIIADHVNSANTQTLTDIWEKCAAAAAGWLREHRTNTNPLTVDHPDVIKATSYFKASFPEAVAQVEPANDAEISNDIIAQFGKMFGNMIGGPLGGVIGGMVTTVAGSVLDSVQAHRAGVAGPATGGAAVPPGSVAIIPLASFPQAKRTRGKAPGKR